MAEVRAGSTPPGVATGRTVPLYVGFFATGVATVLLGPLLPELAGEWRLPVEELRSLFVAQFLASAVGSLVSSYRLGLSLLVGYLLIALGLALLAIADWPVALVPVAAMGLGLGLAIPSTNLWVAHAQPARRGAALSSLNLVWGVGAVTCPLLFAARPRGVSSDAVLVVLAVFGGVILLSLVATRGEAPGRDVPAEAPESGRSAGRRRLAALFAIAGIMFLYVGIETSVGGWLVSLADQIQTSPAASSLLVGSGFWAALLASRALAPLLLRRMTEPTLFAAGILLAAAGLIGLMVARTAAGIAVSAAATGAGLAPLFPLALSFLADLTAATRSRGTGWVFAVAGTGGAVLPWLTAQLAGGPDRLAAGFIAPVGGLVLLALCFGVLCRFEDTQPDHYSPDSESRLT